MSQYFPKPYRRSDRHINVKLDLSSYVTQSDLKNVICVYTLTTKSNSAELKDEVDKICIDKLKAVPTDLSKLSHIVDNDVVKKTVYVKLVAKVNNIDTSGFVLKTKYDKDKSNLIKKSVISEIGSKILSTTDLLARVALTAVQNKIPDVSNLVKTYYDAKISGIESEILLQLIIINLKINIWWKDETKRIRELNVLL